MPGMRIDWATARVEDRELAVRLAGDRPKGWKRSFRTTARLLHNGDWGMVELKKGTIYVGDVSAGTEEKLRHHLESLVEQANAATSDPEADSHEVAEDDEPETQGPDAELTEHFRSFADHGE